MKVREYRYEDIPQIARIHVKSWQSTYKDILPETYLNDLTDSLESSIKHHQNQYGKNKLNKTIVAEEDNSLCGFLIYGPKRHLSDDDKAAEIYALYILDSHQHKGIGHQMMAYAAKDLLDKNYSELRIWALKDNKYRQFYDKLSGVVKDEKNIIIGEESFGEVCYHYKLNDLTKVLDKSHERKSND